MRNKFAGKSPDEMMDMLEHGNINERAVALALRYGMIDGSHHKQWVIDQMLRLIAGEGYSQVMEIFNSDDEYEKWDCGIAP